MLKKNPRTFIPARLDTFPVKIVKILFNSLYYLLYNLAFYTARSYCKTLVVCICRQCKCREQASYNQRTAINAMLDTFGVKIFRWKMIIPLNEKCCFNTYNVSSIVGIKVRGLACFRCILFVPATNNNENKQGDRYGKCKNLYLYINI